MKKKFLSVNILTLCCVGMCESLTPEERAIADKFGTAVAQAATDRVVKEIEGSKSVKVEAAK